MRVTRARRLADERLLLRQEPGATARAAPAISAPPADEHRLHDYYGNATSGRRTPVTTRAERFNSASEHEVRQRHDPLNGTGGNGSAAHSTLRRARTTPVRSKDTARQGHRRARPGTTTTKILQVRGTIYIDGGLTQSQDATYRESIARGAHPSGELTGNDGIGGQDSHLRVRDRLTCPTAIVRLGHRSTTRPPSRGSSCDFNASGHRTPRCSCSFLTASTSASLGGGNGCYFQGAIYSMNLVDPASSASSKGR